MASTIVLSHQEQLERLKVSCPEAVPVSVVAGDPCFDQLQASLPFRESYRRALGVHPGQKLIVVSSTWGHGSILGSGHAERDILRTVLAELPSDEYRVLAAIHPNAWYGHGAWQLQNWLAPLMEHGLLLPAPETDTWKAALLAADVLIGDHGSLTMYGTSLGIPTLLGAFAESKVAARSPMADLGRELPRYSDHAPLLPQLTAAISQQPHDPSLARLGAAVTSRPGEAAALLRQLFYRRLGLTEPGTPAVPRVVPPPSTVPVGPPFPCAPAVYVSAVPQGSPTMVHRYPAALQRPLAAGHLAGTHLVADINDPDDSWVRAADVLVLPTGRPLHAAGEEAWRGVFRRYPGAALLSVEEAIGGALVLLPNGGRLRTRWVGPQVWWASSAVAASVVHDRVVSTAPAEEPMPARVPVALGVDGEMALLDVTVL